MAYHLGTLKTIYPAHNDCVHTVADASRTILTVFIWGIVRVINIYYIEKKPIQYRQ